MTQELPKPETWISGLLSSANTFVIVTTAALPLSGVLVRWIRLRLAEVNLADRIAVSAPIGELAFEGVGPILLGLFALLLSYVLARVFPPPGSRPRSRLGRVANAPWNSGAASIIVGLVVLGALVAVYGLVILPVLVVALSTVAYIHWVRRGQPWRGRWGATVLLMLYFPNALAVGVLPSPGRPGDYAIVAPGVASGQYITGGRTDTTMLLLPCAKPGAVVEVPHDAIASVAFPAPPDPPDVIEVIRESPTTMRRGFYSACP